MLARLPRTQLHNDKETDRRSQCVSSVHYIRRQSSLSCQYPREPSRPWIWSGMRSYAKVRILRLYISRTPRVASKPEESCHRLPSSMEDLRSDCVISSNSLRSKASAEQRVIDCTLRKDSPRLPEEKSSQVKLARNVFVCPSSGAA